MSLPQRYTYAQAAKALEIKESWLRQHIKKLPHIKLAGDVTFTDEQLVRILQIHTYEPPGLTPAAVPAPAGSHPLASLRPLPSRGARRTG